MGRQALNELLVRLGPELGIAELGLDDDGYCLLRVDDRIEMAVEMEEDSDSVVLTANCGPLAESNKPRVLQELLSANFYWTGSGDGTLSTNSETGHVYLQFREPMLNLDLARLKILMHSMISNADFWTSRLGVLAMEQPPKTEAAPVPVINAIQV
jgi:hypothetical protein